MQILLNTLINNFHLLAAHFAWQYLKWDTLLRTFSPLLHTILVKEKSLWTNTRAGSARYKNETEILNIQCILTFFNLCNIHTLTCIFVTLYKWSIFLFSLSFLFPSPCSPSPIHITCPLKRTFILKPVFLHGFCRYTHVLRHTYAYRYFCHCFT